MNKEEIINNLETDIIEKREIISDVKGYNKRCKTMRNVIKTGKVVERLLPYILSSSIVFYEGLLVSKTPFIIDTTTKPVQIEITDMSNGTHIESKRVFDNIDVRKIEYSTAWEKNKYGKFQREITTYLLNPNLNLNDTDKIFSMSKEELDNEFIKASTDFCVKESLNVRDDIYFEEVITITNVKNTDEIITEKETSESNIISTILYLIMAFLVGQGVSGFKKIITYDYVYNRLNQLEKKYEIIDSKKIDEIKKIIEIQEENLDLLEGKTKIYER